MNVCRNLFDLKALFIVFVVFFSLSVLANEVDIAKTRLARAKVLLDRIAPDAERLDQARLVILRKAVMKVQNSIEKNRLSTITTLAAYHELIVKLRFSSAFFTEISTSRTVDAIKELLKLNEQMKEARQFDDTPYTKITESVYVHMETLFRELLNNRSIPDSLRKQVGELIPEVGKLLSDAAHGDRPNTFKSGIKFYKMVVDVYPEFDEVKNSHEAFNIVLEIQGLNEFYGEYAQVTYQDE